MFICRAHVSNSDEERDEGGRERKTKRGMRAGREHMMAHGIKNKETKTFSLFSEMIETPRGHCGRNWGGIKETTNQRAAAANWSLSARVR